MAGSMLNLDHNSPIPISAIIPTFSFSKSATISFPTSSIIGSRKCTDSLLVKAMYPTSDPYHFAVKSKFIFRISIRGEPNEDAVLCSSSNTYALKFVSTSNSVFLVPPEDVWVDSSKGDCTSSSWASGLKVSSGSMELVHIAPKLDKLEQLIHQNPQKPEEEEEDEYGIVDNMQPRRGLYQWSDLINFIQASDEELRAGLKAILAVEINGYWLVVDERSTSEVLRSLLNNSNLYEWSLTSLKETEVITSIEADGFLVHWPFTVCKHLVTERKIKEMGLMYGA